MHTGFPLQGDPGPRRAFWPHGLACLGCQVKVSIPQQGKPTSFFFSQSLSFPSGIFGFGFPGPTLAWPDNPILPLSLPLASSVWGSREVWGSGSVSFLWW